MPKSERVCWPWGWHYCSWECCSFSMLPYWPWEMFCFWWDWPWPLGPPEPCDSFRAEIGFEVRWKIVMSDLIGLFQSPCSSNTTLFFPTGIISFFGGIFLVLIRWPITGMICQLYGLVYLFGQFFPIAAQSMQDTPIIGDILKMPMIENFFASFGGGNQRRAPV